MREDNIRIEGIPSFRVLSLIAFQCVNEHMVVNLTGNIDEDTADGLDIRMFSGESIEVWLEGAEQKTKKWLDGIIENLQLRNTGGMCIVDLHITSRSKLSDIHKYTRSFQNISDTYQDIISSMPDTDDKLEILITNSIRCQAINRFIIQYQETNWEFLKRLASYNHSYLMTCNYLERNGIYMGIPSTVECIQLDTNMFSVSRNLKEYYVRKADGGSEYLEAYSMSFIIESRAIYHLGECICLNGINLHVFSIQSRLASAELIHVYTLKPKEGFRTSAYYNQNLTGTMLIGNVLDIKRDQVKVALNGDIQQQEYCWFPYSTIYSSTDDTGWYFMPEIGDQVRLVFPSSQEEEAYVINSVHLEERVDPDIKSIRTRSHKEIVFAPDSIHISNGCGEYLTLHDNNGITLHSDHQIIIESHGDIDFNSKKRIEIVGEKGVSLIQKDNSIEIDDTIDITAGRLRMR